MALAATMALPSWAIAQPAPRVGVPGPVPQGSPIPRVLPRPAPPLTPAVPSPTPVSPGQMPDVSVAVAAVRIDGATAFSPVELAPLVAGLVGPAVPLERIEEARTALLRRYRDGGYPLTAVSAEIEPGGRLRFVVAEGRIAEVKLDGDIGPAATQVLLFLQRLVTEGPLDQATLERQLLLAQEVPGVTLRAVLRPMPGAEPGTLQLIAQVSRELLSGLVAADNRGFELVGPEQAVALMSLNSLTQFGERTDFVLFRSINGTQTFGQVGVEAFIGASGLKLRVQAGAGNSMPSGSLRAIGYEGTTTNFSIGVTYPLVRRRDQSVTLFALAEALQNDVSVGGPSGVSSLLSTDSLRPFRVGADWARRDFWVGDDRPALSTANIRLTQATAALGASSNGAALAGRVNQVVDFRKANGEITRNQAIFSPWEGATFGVFGMVAGQYSGDILPPIEKFYLGGLRMNRGYYAGEVSGDSALSTTVELRLDDVYSIRAFGATVDLTAQYYAFWDWGQAWDNGVDAQTRRLSSVGAGVRFIGARNTEIQLEGVSRLVTRPQGELTVDPLSTNAFYWRVLQRF
ncbi:ShlB/FhaC/HecB family hemolysin secretion/activation protein [Falsiroseomonas sp. HW251]|uniref:ShlB/FhaC/HecB family hemolysin secretion/activation protein n=1 Tax=Falsiroseomonas sp. HW251 TaxID=3390998 RepID=UPI003D312755